MDLKTQLETVAKNHQALIQNLETKFDILADKKSGRPSGSLPSNTQRLRKEKMEAQYGKFLDMIRAVRINVPFIDVLARMPNYGKFLKELINNKHKIEQISAAFLSDESSAMIQNKVPPKLGDPESFLIPCNFNKTFSCNALADLAENMLVEVGKFTFPVDFIILEMEEDKTTQPGVELERMIFNIDSAMKHRFIPNDDTVFNIDVIDEIHKQAFAWKTTDIPGIYPSFCKHKIQLLDDKKPVVQKQRRLNPNMHEVVKKEIMKLLDTGIIYRIADSPWVSPIHCVPKKGGIIVVTNENDELVPTRTVMGWRVWIDYRKLNEETAKDHFPLPFMDQMLERLAGNKYLYFLNGFYGYFQIPIDPNDQEKTTFTCSFGTYAYRRMPFGIYNAPATFQRCMLVIFHDMIEEFVKEKCHFIVKEGIVLGHKVFSVGLEVDKVKINVISKLTPPTNIKGIRSFLGHVGFYRCFIKDISKIARPLTKLLEKDTPFEFDDECQKAFESLKEKLTCALVIISPNWNLPFELMCDASDFVVGAVLGQKDGKNFHPISFASKTLNPAQQKYTVTKKELWL
ncbi:reverse transcriptase domain-containing protein [Tanacetum coccineum]